MSLDPLQSVVRVDENTVLQLRHWQPSEVSQWPPVLLVHGYGEHIGRYEHVASCLTQKGFDVWGYDVRGHGLSDGARGYIAQDDELVSDCLAVFQYVTDLTQQSPIVIAHSMGGLTAALAVTDYGLKPAALVLSSPCLRTRMNFLQKCLLNVGLLLMKNRPIDSPAVDALYVSRDPKIVADYRSDPLNHSMISARLGRWLRSGGERVLAKAQAFTMPTLLIYAGDDQVVDPTGSHDLAKILPDHTQVRCYESAYHEIFNEPLPERTVILNHMVDWLLEVVSSLNKKI